MQAVVWTQGGLQLQPLVLDSLNLPLQPWQEEPHLHIHLQFGAICVIQNGSLTSEFSFFLQKSRITIRSTRQLTAVPDYPVQYQMHSYRAVWKKKHYQHCCSELAYHDGLQNLEVPATEITLPSPYKLQHFLEAGTKSYVGRSWLLALWKLSHAGPVPLYDTHIILIQCFCTAPVSVHMG